MDPEPKTPPIRMTPQERRIARLYIRLLRAQYEYVRDRATSEKAGPVS